MNDANYALANFSADTLQGPTQSLAEYAGKVLLIVNTASHCGFTPQYAGLEALYRKYKDRGLLVLGFPCNQFLGQEPGDEKQIQAFCDLNYKIEFPMFAKIEVNGSGTHPLYRLLKREARGFLGTQRIRWNFTKFLVSPEGKVLTRFATRQTPEDIEAYAYAVDDHHPWFTEASPFGGPVVPDV